MLEKWDHRQIGQRLDLFHLQEEALGMVFWHARGWRVFQSLEAAVRRQFARDGFEEVRTPQVLRDDIWQASGHRDNFAENMFFLGEDGASALKPVSCPGHIQLLKRRPISHRELPLRLSELGLVHRNEQSGSLHGLFRLRQFTQDDGHIFCAPEQVGSEVERFCASLASFYRALGFEQISVAFSSRPPKRAGSDEVWDRAEAALQRAAVESGLSVEPRPGEGAFYGPKLEFSLRDGSGRAWQCGTIQLDFVLAERFDLAYVGADGAPRRPVLLHRAMLGSLERFVGILLEENAGVLPPWLSPEQVRILPVAPAHLAYAEEVLGVLREAGLRASVEAGKDRLARRVLDAHEQAVPFVLVVGDKEAQAKEVSLREDGRMRSGPLREVLAELRDRCAPPM